MRFSRVEFLCQGIDRQHKTFFSDYKLSATVISKVGKHFHSLHKHYACSVFYWNLLRDIIFNLKYLRQSIAFEFGLWINVRIYTEKKTEAKTYTWPTL